MRIWKEFTFDASHQLRALPPDHACSRLHGHTYRFRLHVAGALQRDLGWITDWGGEVRAVADLLLAELDHRHLNDIPGLETPTAEQLALWIWDAVGATRLGPLAPGEDPRRPHLVAVELYESATTGVWYDGAPA